jgi:hypothetical protein
VRCVTPIWASWGDLSSGFSNDIAVFGHFECKDAIYKLELKVEFQLILSGGVNHGSYKLTRKEQWDFGKRETNGEHTEKDVFECEPGKEYRLIANAKVWYSGGYSPWWAYSVDGRPERCSAAAEGPEPE